MEYLPCVLCGRKLDKRTSKNGKPYFVCDSCGMQLFIRRKQGISLLEKAFHNIEKARIPFAVHDRSLYEIQARIKEIDGVEKEIEKLGTPLFMSDSKLRVRNSLKTRLDNLLFQLQHMAKQDDEI